jgi:hypothetical protein
MSYYTIQQFKDILFDGINNKLSEETKNKISELSSLINITDAVDTVYKKVKRNDNGELYKRGYKSKELEEDWESVRNFKVTKIDKKEGIEKKINEIRIALNKISEKNKIEQTTKIIELISIVFESNEDMNENMEKIVKFVFDTASSNAFYSEIYAELYKNILTKFSQFQSKLGDIVINYKKSFEEINPVDPNVDYDAYCDFIKENDKRKSMTTFMCNLTKYDILESETLYQIIKYITFKIREHSTLNDSISIVEELCDNLYILITTTYELYKTDETFHSEIMKELKEISLYRKTDKVLYKSMTSRASFKILDTIEYVEKQ